MTCLFISTANKESTYELIKVYWRTIVDIRTDKGVMENYCGHDAKGTQESHGAQWKIATNTDVANPDKASTKMFVIQDGEYKIFMKVH